ncbi:MAG: 50S ribosomal protein L16 [bacterium (Candidatus Ratteibacteria) CG23_combo_of_CG06-09_8_20_14_all_48_7]|uniref:Large ribosomal subunit protein uL16 n=1 Tax=bacterium (Candidatus Ratteibacteria) CG23_combo_of_CG06-09_8_20_14_all_48_7 TaxID=2014292 RepID=A0A2G9Y8C6_9BACT|nr:MAG: 50S ribosomal protein L16 [bacterium (Candidatus Ratteibacteria) CG23_combo_of_CG06-09_8_20_14_all_48_7]
MPLIPKRVKFRNMHGGRTRGKATTGNTLFFGEYGLLALAPGYFTERQIEAARVAVTHHLKGKGKLWIRVFPDRPVSKKPAETRMGKGKGDLDHWTCRILPGRVILELTGVGRDEAVEALRLASGKFPLTTKIITR